MLAKEFSWIPFHVVACNSQENGTDVQLLANQKHPTNKSWESSRSGSYPIEIIIRFHYRSELNHILLCSKLDKNIPGIEVYIGDGLSGSFLDAEYRLAGQYEQINNKQVQVPLQGIGNFLKIKIKQKPLKSAGNPYQQVSMAVLRVWGRYTSYITKIQDQQIPLEMDSTNIDKILIGMGIPIDLLNWHDQDQRQWEYAPIDEETRITVGDLNRLKQQALVQSDYEMLKALTLDIKKVFDIGIEIHKLMRELKFSIAKEDYNRAMELKKRLLDLRNRRDAFDALYETSRYEKMVSQLRPNTAEFDNMVRLMDEEAENDRLRNRQRDPEPEDFPPPRPPTVHDHISEKPEDDDDERKIQGDDKGLAWWEKTTGQDMKFKTKRKKRQEEEEKNDRIESKFKNPFAFNEGDVDLEMYFKPLIVNTGDQLEDIPAEMLRRLYNLGYLTVFGAKVWSAIHSENWRHREAAAQAVLNFIEMPLPDKYLNGNSKNLFLASMELAKLATEDKILSIYFIGLKILSTALSPPVCGDDVSPKLINQAIKEFIPLLVEKIAELNFRSRNISMHTLLSVFKHPVVEVGDLIKYCLKICIEDPNFSSLYTPPDKQPERVIKARLEIILSIVQDQGIDERQWQWTDAFIYLCVPSLFHPANEVRMLSIELIVAMYLVIGEDVRNTVNDVDMKPNLYEIIIVRMDEIKEQAIANQKIRDETRGEILREEEEKQQFKNNQSGVSGKSQSRFRNKSMKKTYKPGDDDQFKEEVRNLQGKIEEKGVSFILDCIIKSKNTDKPFGALISMNPPASYYNQQQVAQNDSSIAFNCNLDYTSPKEYPHFLNTYCDFLNVSPQGSIIIDLKYIDNLKKEVVKDYGWSILPLYSELGELFQGEIQLPVFKPPVNQQIINAIPGQPSIQDFIEKQMADKNSNLKYVEWTSIVVRLNHLKDKNSRQYQIQNLNQQFLPQKKLDKIIYTQKMFDQGQKDKLKKPLSKIINKTSEEEFQTQIEAVFKKHIGLDNKKIE